MQVDMLEMLFFAGLFGVAILEMVLSRTRNRLYFLVGVPIFRYETQITHLRPIPVDGKELEDALPEWKHGPMEVHKLTDKAFAFRKPWGPVRVEFQLVCTRHARQT